MMNESASTLIRAVADLAKGVAWPLVALTAGIVYRRELGDLLRRVRKGAGAEFDPPSQGSVVPNTSKAIAASVTAPSLPATPSVIALETMIKNLPLMQQSAEPEVREGFLIRLAARGALSARFEQIDSAIWKSQVDLLSYLNSKRDGEGSSVLEGLFYSKAAVAHPDVFHNYSLVRYLGFLRAHDLITVDNDLIKITQDGIDFLAWRLEQGKPPKTSG